MLTCALSLTSAWADVAANPHADAPLDTTATLSSRPAHNAPLRQSQTSVSAPPEAATFRVRPQATTTARAQSVEDLLRDAPGIFLLRHASEGKGAQYFVRGFDAQHGTDLELTLDGVPLNLDSHIHGHGYIDLSWLPKDALAEFQYRGGSYDLRQGPFATGGSLELRLPSSAHSHRFEVALSGNSQARASLSIVTQSQHAQLSQLSVSEFSLANSWAEARFGTRVATLHRLQWGGVDGKPAQSLIVAAGHTRFEVPTFLRRNDVREGLWRGHSYLHDLSGLTTSGRAQWKLSHRIRASLQLETQAAFSVHQFRYDENATGYLLSPDGDTRVQEESRQSLYLSTALRQRIGRDHRLQWLVGTQITHASQSIRMREPERDGVPTPIQDTDFWLPHLFTGVEWQAFFADWLQSQLSLRADVWHLSPYEATLDRRFSSTVGALSPRLKLRARLHDDWALTLAAGFGQRPSEVRAVIQANDRTNVGTEDDSYQRERFGNGRARLTTSRSADIGVHWEREQLRAQVALFGIWLSNESFYDHVAGLTYLLNPTRRLGVEADLTWSPLAALQLGGKFSAVHARFIDSGAPVAGAPTLFSSFFLGARHADILEAEVTGRVVGERVLRYDARAGAYVLLDASFSVRPKPWLSLTASVENVLNAVVEEALYNFPSRWQPEAPASQLPRLHTLYGSPRTFWFELRVHL